MQDAKQLYSIDNKVADRLDYIIDGQPMSYWAIKNKQDMKQWLLTRSPIYSRYHMAPQLFSCVVDYELEQLVARKLERLNVKQ